ncbi:MAG: M48 family metallopeptidase [Candidatus Andersenbacteria bacterium]|nr:M48 family metallopeptidase [Candidatus Andersenbacteria bacterium]
MNPEKSKIAFQLRRSKRAKRIVLKVGLDGSVELIIPRWVSMRAAHTFFASKQGWLQRILRDKKVRQTVPLKNGDSVQFFGTSLICVFVIRSGRARVKNERGKLLISASSQPAALKAVETWYRQNSKRMFYEFIAGFNIEDVQVRVSGAKTRWGSCNRRRRSLMFNWRLALAPIGVARYVVAHEVAHLTHPNHSRQFWAHVGQFFPSYAQERQWLKEKGHSLVLEQKFSP